MSKAIKRLYHDLNHLEPNIIFPQDLMFVMSREFAEELKLELEKVLQPQLNDDVGERINKIIKDINNGEIYKIDIFALNEHIQEQANEIERLQTIISNMEAK